MKEELIILEGDFKTRIGTKEKYYMSALEQQEGTRKEHAHIAQKRERNKTEMSSR